MEKSIVQLIVVSAESDIWKPFIEGGENSCSGSDVIIDSKNLLLLTNYHVIQQAKNISCRFYESEDLLNINLIAYNIERDLALCQITDKPPIKVKQLELSKEFPKMGDEVYVVGFPLGNELKMTKGILSGNQPALNPVPGKTTVEATFQLETSSPANPGDSGGALLYNGKLVGIVDGGIPQANAVSYAIPSPIVIEELNKMLSIFKQNKNYPVRVCPHFWSIFAQPLTADMKSWLKQDQGILVTDVLPETLFPKVEIGDIITEIDDKKIISPVMLENNVYFKKYFQSNNCQTITVIRKNKKLTIKADNRLSFPNLDRIDFYLQIPDYFIISGICFMILTKQHVDEMIKEGDLRNASYLYNCPKPQIFISYCFFDPLATLKVDILNEVVYTINDKNPLLYLNNRFKEKVVTIITTSKKLLHFKVDEKLDKDIKNDYHLDNDCFPLL